MVERQGQDGQNETEQPDHSASLGDSITSSTRIRFSVHTGDRAARRWAIRSRWPDKAPSVRLPLPCRRSLVRVHRMETAGRRGTKVRNSSHRLTAWKCLQAAEYVCVTCLASPCRAGGSRSRPQAGGAGRANSASLEGLAPVRPHGDKQVAMLGTLINQAPVYGRSSIRCRRHYS